jgi:hypothetical protein
MNCRSVFENFNIFVVGPLGILFNLIALLVIRKCGARELATYRVVLTITCCSDLLIAFYALLMGTVCFLKVWGFLYCKFYVFNF